CPYPNIWPEFQTQTTRELVSHSAFVGESDVGELVAAALALAGHEQDREVVGETVGGGLNIQAQSGAGYGSDRTRGATRRFFLAPAGRGHQGLGVEAADVSAG